MKKCKFFSVLLIFLQLCILSSCKDKDDDMMIGDKPKDYFRSPAIYTCPYFISPDEGTDDMQLYGHSEEDVIPIIWICDSEEYFDGEYKISYGYENKPFYPSAVFEADGFAEYPNNLDYKYQYEWVKVSTYKEKGNPNGVLHLEYEANNTDEVRDIYIYLRNQDEGLLWVHQEPKRDVEKK